MPRAITNKKTKKTAPSKRTPATSRANAINISPALSHVEVEPAWIDPPTTTWHFDFGKFSFGLFLVVAGLLYLAKNTGWLPLDLQFDLWQLWPMLLIFFGLSFISGKGWTGLLTGSIFTITVLVIATIFISDKVTLRLEPELTNIPALRGHLPSMPSEKNFPINIDQLSSSRSSNINVTHKLGILNISDSDTKLASGQLTSNYAKLLINSQNALTSQSVQIESVAQNSRAGQSENQLNLQLSNTLSSNLDLNVGASTTDLNLKNLLVKNLNLNSTGSEINLSLANQSIPQNLQLNGQISTLTLNLPLGTSIKITCPSIKDLDLDNFKSLDEDTILSKDYQDSSSSIRLDLSSQPDKLIINWQ